MKGEQKMSKILNMLMAFIMSFGISGSNVNPSDIPENSNFEVHFIDVSRFGAYRM